MTLSMKMPTLLANMWTFEIMIYIYFVFLKNFHKTRLHLFTRVESEKYIHTQREKIPPRYTYF